VRRAVVALGAVCVAAALAAPAACGRSDSTPGRVGPPRWERLTPAALADKMAYAGALRLESVTPVPAAGDQHALEGRRVTATAHDLPDVMIELLHTDKTWRETYRTLAAGAHDPPPSAVSTYVTLTAGRVGVVIAAPAASGMGYEAMMPTDDAEQFVVVTTLTPVTGALQGQPPLKWTAALAGAVDQLLFGR
jgi:hypothetical protein